MKRSVVLPESKQLTELTDDRLNLYPGQQPPIEGLLIRKLIALYCFGRALRNDTQSLAHLRPF